MEYTPRLSHSVFTAVFGIVLLASAGLWFDGSALIYITLGGFLLVGYSMLIMYWIGSREHAAYYDAITRFAEQLSRLDVDQWQALGIKFPTLRIHWNGKPVLLFEDSGVRMEHFERFLNDSNARYVSPERNWSGGSRRRIWIQIMNWLEAHKFIYPDSAAGSHSWLWRGNAYNILRERYLYSHVEPASLNVEEDFMTGAPAGGYSEPFVSESGA